MTRIGLADPAPTPLRRLIRDSGWKGDSVVAATVHRFQGDKKDLIIFDSVVDYPSSRLGRLLEGELESNATRLINVAWTRAKAKLLFVGNVPHLKAAISGDRGFTDFFWEARGGGDHDGSVALAAEAIAPSQYLTDFLSDLQKATRVVVHSPTLTDQLAEGLLRARTRGADVTLVVGSYVQALEQLERAGVRIGFDDDCTFLAWLDQELVWFGRGTAARQGVYFRQMWPSTAQDLWNLTGMDRLLRETSSPTRRMAERISWREGSRCEKWLESQPVV